MRDSPPVDRPLEFFLDLFGKVLVSDLGNNYIHRYNPGHDRNQVDDPLQRYARTSGNLLILTTLIIQDTGCSSR